MRRVLGRGLRWERLELLAAEVGYAADENAANDVWMWPDMEPGYEQTHVKECEMPRLLKGLR